MNGTCNGGTCTCLAGWINAPNGTACATCDTGFFLDPSSNNCVSCGSGCKACTATACTTCLPGTVPLTGSPTVCAPAVSTTCGKGTFQSGTGTSCQVCNSLCQECNGPNQTDCTECLPNAFLFGGRCLTPDTTGKCNGTSLIADKRKSVCDTCPRNCAQCSIPNFDPNAATQDLRQCDQCLPGFVLDNGNCVATCPAGKIVSSDGKTCTGRFAEFSYIRKTLTSIYSLHRRVCNLCQQPELLPNLLYWPIRLQRTMRLFLPDQHLFVKRILYSLPPGLCNLLGSRLQPMQELLIRPSRAHE